MLPEWQSVLIRFVAAIAVVGTVILVVAFVCLLLSEHQDVVERAAIFLILGAVGMLMILATSVISEKDVLSDRLPKWSWKGVGIAFVAGLTVLPVTHFLFLLHVGFVSICAVSVLSSDASKMRGVAVCNAFVGVVLVSVWQTSGAWDDGDLLRAILSLYAVVMMLLPGFLSIASVFRLHQMAQYCMYGFAVQAFHSLAIVLAGVTMMLNEAFDREREPLNQDRCFESNAYSPVTGILWLLSLISEMDDYEGGSLDYPCYDPNPSRGDSSAVAAVTHVAVNSGGQAEVTLLAITAAYVVALAAVCYTFPFHLRQVHAEEDEHVVRSTSERLKAAACRCFAAIMKSIARLICVSVFVVAAIVLFSLFVVLVENSETSVEASRRLQQPQALPAGSLPPMAIMFNDTEIGNSSSFEDGGCLEVCWTGADLPNCPWLLLSFSATSVPDEVFESSLVNSTENISENSSALVNSTGNAYGEPIEGIGASEEDLAMAFRTEELLCRAEPVCQLCHICSAALPICQYNNDGDQLCGPCFKAEELVIPTVPPRDDTNAIIGLAVSGAAGFVGLVLLVAVWRAPCWKTREATDDDDDTVVPGQASGRASISSSGTGTSSRRARRSVDQDEFQDDIEDDDDDEPREVSVACRSCRTMAGILGVLLLLACLVLLIYGLVFITQGDLVVETGLPSEAECRRQCLPVMVTAPPTTTSTSLADVLAANDTSTTSQFEDLWEDDDDNNSWGNSSNTSEFDDDVFSDDTDVAAVATLPPRAAPPTTSTLPTTTATTTTTVITDRCFASATCRQCEECTQVLPTCDEAPTVSSASAELRQPRGGYFEWAWMPALYLAETWCDFGPWAPIGICSLTFAFQAYTCSIVASDAAKRQKATLGKMKPGTEPALSTVRISQLARQTRMEARGFTVTDILPPEPRPPILDVDDDGVRVFKV